MINSPKISIKIVKDISFNTSGCVKADLWYYGRFGEDFVYYERKIFFMNDKLLIKDLRSDSPKIIATKFCAKKSLSARGSLRDLIGCTLSLLNVRKGFVAIHAACVSKGIITILMPAMPNTGKTYTTLWFLKRGYSYLADDTLLVDKNGIAYANPIASAVNSKILEVVSLGTLKNLNLRIRSKLLKIPGSTKILKPYMLKTWKAVSNTKILEKANITHTCILAYGPEKVEELSNEQAVNIVQGINRYSLPRPYVNPVLQAYNFFNPDFKDIRDFDINERRILLSILEKTEKYIICSKGRWGELIENILKR